MYLILAPGLKSKIRMTVALYLASQLLFASFYFFVSYVVRHLLNGFVVFFVLRTLSLFDR